MYPLGCIPNGSDRPCVIVQYHVLGTGKPVLLHTAGAHYDVGDLDTMASIGDWLHEFGASTVNVTQQSMLALDKLCLRRAAWLCCKSERGGAECISRSLLES